MRFTKATQCTSELLLQLDDWHAEGLTVEAMRLRLARHGVYVSQSTVREWHRGRVPQGIERPVLPRRLIRGVPRGTRLNQPLRFESFTGPYAFRANYRGGTYAIGVYHNAKTDRLRYLCWWFPEGVHRFDREGCRVSGGPPVGLFSMRRQERAARADAVHHCRTGEVLP